MLRPKGRITPLWIIAALVALTEMALSYALTQTTGGVQVALTVFVIVFALLVTGVFFAILWNRPFVFYPPSEYGNVDPKSFIDAIKESVSPAIVDQVKLLRLVQSDPENKDAQYSLINSLIDPVTKQHIILMAEKNLEIPHTDMMGHQYSLGSKGKNFSAGMFQPRKFVEKLEGTQFVELVQHEGVKIKLTKDGAAFGKWLVENGQKEDFVETPHGGWGEPIIFDTFHKPIFKPPTLW